MSEFSYSDYERAAQQQNTNMQKDTQRVGYFKLPENMEAYVRFNCSTTLDLPFAKVHKPVYGKKYEGLTNPYAGISCLEAFGSNSGTCPLCEAAKKEDRIAERASSKVYLKMLVSYINADGTLSEPQAVVWERPAQLANDIATLLRDYGDLKNNLFKITRNGSGTATRYNINYVLPSRLANDPIPADFSAFDNFDLAKHSYYKKDLTDLREFVITGKFSDIIAEEATAPIAQPTFNAQSVEAASGYRSGSVAPEYNSAPQQPQSYNRPPWATTPESDYSGTPPTRNTNYSF